MEVPTSDFQDLQLRRRQGADLAAGPAEEYRRPVLAPMTLVNPGHVSEISGALKDAGIDIHHLSLNVSREVLEKRTDRPSFTPDTPQQDKKVRRWCKEKSTRCMAAADTLPSDTVFLDGELAPQELADQVPARARAGATSGI
ncbi:TmrB-like protein [Streptomyces sp. NPDC058683]|uniref:TmrB-like protein n=1 Tax=Streptomyces sp. NPDC058683 TaxID=3346597 RepID=UPI0036616ACE